MRLLHIMPTFGTGGTELRVVSLINELGAEFSHSIMPLNNVSTAISRVAPSRHVEIIAAPQGKGRVDYPFRLYRSLSAYHPDLALTYNWGTIEAALAIRVAGICPVIHNECGFGPDEATRLKVRRNLARCLLLNGIPRTIVVSGVLYDVALYRFRIRKHRVRLIRTGVDVIRFAPRINTPLRDHLRVTSDDLLFGYVGGLRPEKNVGLLLQAFARAAISRARLVIVGDGPQLAELKALAGQLGLCGQITFAGSIADPAPYYNAMDVFLMSSITEQTPNALLEAMASGLPAICTAVGDTTPILGPDSRTLLVPSGDLGAYAAALRLMACNGDLRSALGEINRSRAVANHSLVRMVQEYRETYLSVLPKIRRLQPAGNC